MGRQKIKMNELTNEWVPGKREERRCINLWWLKKGGCCRVVGQPVLKEQREGNKREGWREGKRETGGRARG